MGRYPRLIYQAPFSRSMPQIRNSNSFKQGNFLPNGRLLDSIEVKVFACDKNDLNYGGVLDEIKKKHRWKRKKMMLVTSISSFSYNVFKNLLRNRLNYGLLDKGFSFYSFLYLLFYTIFKKGNSFSYITSLPSVPLKLYKSKKIFTNIYNIYTYKTQIWFRMH